MSTVAIPTTSSFLSTTSSSIPEPRHQDEEDYNMDQPLHSDVEMLGAEDDDDEMLLDEDAQGAHASGQIQNTASSPLGSSRMEEDEKDGGFDIALEEVNDERNGPEEDEQLLDADRSTPVPVAVEENVGDDLLDESDAEITVVEAPTATVVEDTQSVGQLPAEEATSEPAVAQVTAAAEADAKESGTEVVPEGREEEIVVAEVAEVAEDDSHLSTAPVAHDLPESQEVVTEGRQVPKRETDRAEIVVAVDETDLSPDAEVEQENQVEALPDDTNAPASLEHEEEIEQTAGEVRSVRTDFPSICAILRKDDLNYLLCPSDVSDDLVVELEAQPILEDYAILSQPLATMFAVLRGVFNDALAADCELVLEAPQLGLSVSEDNVFCHEVTVYDLVELYSGLNVNDNTDISNAPFFVHLNAQVRFLSRFNHIAEVIRQGRGLQYLYDEDATAIAKQQAEYHTRGDSDSGEGQRLDANTLDVEVDTSSYKPEVQTADDTIYQAKRSEATRDGGEKAFNDVDNQGQAHALLDVVNGSNDLPSEIIDGGKLRSQAAVSETEESAQTLLAGEEEPTSATSADVVVAEKLGNSKRSHDDLDDDDQIVVPEDKRVKSVSE
ncbi:hypothetical protein V1517DRAFT_336913 [Lipomyces orientalis]|uniref:Uncharacterized protein n=1 Tax=Lipomyces orientalis TaxID=1233043 RepID=A0ACC3TU28_9ASCO